MSDEMLVSHYLGCKESKLTYYQINEWINRFGLKPYHLEILNCIKHGDLTKLKEMNDDGWYIYFHKDKMLKVAIENEQIDMIEYLAYSKQINKNINNYLSNVSPTFFEELMERFGCYNNEDTAYNTKPIFYYVLRDKEIPKDYLYRYYKSLCVIDPNEVYEWLVSFNKYHYDTEDEDKKKYYKYNNKLKSHLEEKYNCSYEYKLPQIHDNILETSYYYLQKGKHDELMLIIKEYISKDCRYFTETCFEKMTTIFELFNYNINELFNEYELNINKLITTKHGICCCGFSCKLKV